MGLPHWQDAAVRNLAQDQRSPLMIVSSMDTRLDDIASQCISLAPDQIAEFGVSIVEALAGESSANQQANEIAEILQSAKNPLIISGTSMSHWGIINSAVAIAESLCVKQSSCMLSLCVPEANSLGVALLADQSSLSLSDLVDSPPELLLVMENDLERRLSSQQMQQLMADGTRVISMDMLENATLGSADMVLPVASYAESQGSLVNMEGRAQRYFPVFEPAAERLPSWQWLLKLAALTGHKSLSKLQHFDQVVAACAGSQAELADLINAAPDHSFRDRGLKIPRQTHRYSGRTAMNAGVNVHEPQQPHDHESPLAYSMEGLNRDQPAALTPYVWSPGWNSNQSLQKFQAEVDGPLKGGTAGAKLILSSASGATQKALQETVEMQPHQWQLVPVHQVHGSDELSVNTDEIAEMAGIGFVALGAMVAEKLGVADGDGVVVASEGNKTSLEVRILRRVAKNCIGFGVGYAETLCLQAGKLATLEADKSWQRRQPQLIATDKQIPDPVIVEGGSAHV
jgi:NADH-quinone oxidoreductase subunit G